MLQTPSSTTLQVRKHIGVILPGVQLSSAQSCHQEWLTMTLKVLVWGGQATATCCPGGLKCDSTAFQTSLLKTGVSGQGGSEPAPVGWEGKVGMQAGVLALPWSDWSCCIHIVCTTLLLLPSTLPSPTSPNLSQCIKILNPWGNLESNPLNEKVGC